MARANFVKAARKAIPHAGINVGDSYYWWQLHRGLKQVSKTPPKRSQLTGSAFLSSLYDIEDDLIQGAAADNTLGDQRDDIVSALEDLKSQCEESLDNLPDSLKDAPTGELLQERISGLESAIDEFEGLEFDEFEAAKGDSDAADDDEPVNEDGQTEQEYWDGKLEELQGVSIDCA